MTKETGRCECFGNSGLCASTHGNDDGVRCCDLCGWPVKTGSFDGLREIAQPEEVEQPSVGGEK